MRTAPIRNRLSPAVAAVLALSLAGAYSACSYDELKPAITIVVHNIPATVDHLKVTLNDASNATVTRLPAFGIGTFTDLEVVFPAPTTTGVVTIGVQALDHDQSALACNPSPCINPTTVAPTLNYTVPGALLDVTLVVETSFVGSFGSPCDSNGNCATGLSCTKYTGSDTGLCTRACNDTSAKCETAPPNSTCAPLKATTGTSICQWECDNPDGGGNLVCPTGLTCGGQISIGGVAKRFCQGAP